MEKKIFATDIDNCVLDWTSAMFEFLREYHTEIKLENLNITDYSFGLEQDLLDDLWREFNKTKHFDDIKPLRDAQIYIPLIAEKYKFYGLTSCLPDDEENTLINITKRRKENLEKYFPKIFDDCKCICIHSSKQPHLSKLDKTFWIDDKAKNVLQGLEEGHDSFIMSFKYNEQDYIGNAKRVSSWKEIYEELFKKENNISE